MRLQRRRFQANGPSLPSGCIVPTINSTTAISDPLAGFGAAFRCSPYTVPYLHMSLSGPVRVSPVLIEGVFRACRRLLHRRAARVLVPIATPHVLASPIEQGLATRNSMTLSAITVMALFTMLAAVRFPTACAFASPLRLAASLSLTWQAKSEIPFTRLCHPTFRTVAGRTRDQAIGPKWEIGRVRTFL